MTTAVCSSNTDSGLPTHTQPNCRLPHLSADMARKFIQEKLQISYFDERFVRNKKRVLEEILESWQDKIPFQTVSQLACHDGGMPSLEENVSAIFSLKGGRCWTHNSVLCLLLRALGYDAFNVMSHVFQPDRNTHLIVIIRNMTSPGSRHLADVAFGSVSPKAIDLGFEKESAIVDGIYTPYKYIKQDGWIIRCHLIKPNKSFFDLEKAEGVTVQGDWMYIYYFKLEETTFEFARQCLEKRIYNNPEHFFNTDILCISVPKGCYTLLHNLKLKYEKTPGGETETVMMKSDDDIINALKSRFPSIPEDEVRCAVNNRKKSAK